MPMGRWRMLLFSASWTSRDSRAAGAPSATAYSLTRHNAPTRSETAQIWTRDHPRAPLLETTRLDGVAERDARVVEHVDDLVQVPRDDEIFLTFKVEGRRRPWPSSYGRQVAGSDLVACTRHLGAGVARLDRPEVLLVLFP